MPYTTVNGRFERAGRTSHHEAVVRALADTRQFYVPAEDTVTREQMVEHIHVRENRPVPEPSERLNAAIAVDGSRMTVPVREGMPSVVFGYAQAAAAYIDLAALESQRAAKFVDPVILERAVNTALISVDLPCAGSFSRPGVDIQTSWRELISDIFDTKKIEANNINKSLRELLFAVYGTPGAPASTLPVNCPVCRTLDVPVPPAGATCGDCGTVLFATDVLRIHEEVTEEGSNDTALGRLMSVVELLVLVGLVDLLWNQKRDLLNEILFIIDGPLAVAGPPAPIRRQALKWVQAASSHASTPHIVGIEKTGAMVDYAVQLTRFEVIEPGDLVAVGPDLLSRIVSTSSPEKYGKETYWGRKFIYRALAGQTLVISVPPATGAPYDTHGGQPDPASYPTLDRILDVLDRTGSSMYTNGIIPVAMAHGAAAYPIGVGTDVLKLAAAQRLGITPTAGTTPGAF